MQKPPWADPAVLTELYWEKQYSLTDIGDLYGVDFRVIHYWMKKFNIPRRNHSQSIALARGNHVALSEQAVEFLEGELLGDGSLELDDGGRSAAYVHSSSRIQYLRWLNEVLQQFGIMPVGRAIYVSHSRSRPQEVGYRYRTRSYQELADLYHRWYSQGKKRIPGDLVLTPLRARQWYIGDGHLERTSKNSWRIRFAVQGFSAGDVVFLAELLKKVGFKASIHTRYTVIQISARRTRDFLHWIGPCPEPIREVYGYKWRVLYGH